MEDIGPTGPPGMKSWVQSPVDGCWLLVARSPRNEIMSSVSRWWLLVAGLCLCQVYPFKAVYVNRYSHILVDGCWLLSLVCFWAKFIPFRLCMYIIYSHILLDGYWLLVAGLFLGRIYPFKAVCAHRYSQILVDGCWLLVCFWAKNILSRLCMYIDVAILWLMVAGCWLLVAVAGLFLGQIYPFKAMYVHRYGQILVDGCWLVLLGYTSQIPTNIFIYYILQGCALPDAGLLPSFLAEGMPYKQTPKSYKH